MKEHVYFVYMLASAFKGTLYVGMTNNLIHRIWQHKEGIIPGFTVRYGVKRLVWYEWHNDVHAAILREKRIKRWKREWKIALIEERNPKWNDLYPDLLARGVTIPPAEYPR